MRRTTASPSATTTSKAMATATPTRDSGTTRGTPESTSQTKKSWLLSAIRVVRGQGTMTHNSRKSCTNNARYTRSRDTCSSSVSPSASHSMHHLSLKQESERTRRMMRRVTSRGLKTSRIRRTSSTSPTRRRWIPFQARAEVDPTRNTLYGAGLVKASEVQRGPDLLLQG
jgi:hypothetical protein